MADQLRLAHTSSSGSGDTVHTHSRPGMASITDDTSLIIIATSEADASNTDAPANVTVDGQAASLIGIAKTTQSTGASVSAWWFPLAASYNSQGMTVVGNWTQSQSRRKIITALVDGFDFASISNVSGDYNNSGSITTVLTPLATASLIVAACVTGDEVSIPETGYSELTESTVHSHTLSVGDVWPLADLTPITIGLGGSPNRSAVLAFEVPAELSAVIKTVSDNGSAVDGLDAILAALALSDTGAGADAQAPAITLSLSDLAAGDDTLAVLFEIIKQVIDAATASEGVAGLGLHILADASSALEVLAAEATLTLNEQASAWHVLQTIAHLVSVDVGSAAASIHSQAVAPVADAGSSTDSNGVQVDAFMVDTSSATDSTGLTVGIHIPDTTTALEALAIVGDAIKTIAESAAGADGLNIALTVPVTDSASALDIASVITELLKTVEDAGSGQVTINTLNTLQIPDSNTGSEAVASTAQTHTTDSGNSAEAVSLTISLPVIDTAAGLDAAFLIDALVSILEAAGATDVQTLIDTEQRLAKITFLVHSGSIHVGIKSASTSGAVH